MDKNLICVQLGALLHDIGKIVRRAGLDNKNYSEAGSNYLKKNNLLSNEYQEIYDIINYHHKNELKSARLKENSLAYIVYEANNIASGIDHVKYDNDKIRGNEMDSLNSIFNVIRIEKDNLKKTFKLFDFDKNSFNMPTSSNTKLNNSDYKKVIDYIKDNLSNFKESISPEKLVVILEACCSYFPSSSYIDTLDVSYYDHVKLTAAISSCFYLYDKEKDIKDFKKEYFLTPDRNRKKFLLVSGEFSGIQNFIYTISSKMAMKSLRGRSFYLELFAEHIIDEILSSLELSRVNLLYSGGSHFYLLLPNSDKTKEILETYKEKINDFILKEIGTTIYFEMVYSETSAEELANGLNKKENRIGELFRKISGKVSKSKLSRYSLEQLKKLFNQNSSINKISSYTKECVICKKAEEEKILENNAREFNGEIQLCNSCKGYIKLGKDISKLYHSDSEMFILEKNCDENETSLIFPKYSEGHVAISIDRKEKISKTLKENIASIYRYYAVNSDYVGDRLCKNIWVGNYNIESYKEDKSLIEFKDLVEKSKGIARLAVFRADVDNLGTLFQSGFENKNSEEPYKNVTLSKSVVLSRYLSDFFKRKINLILEKKDTAKESNELFKKYCDIINRNNPKPRDIVIVYSGGDDVFAIGTWNDIIEFSIDLRTAFKEFTNDKITLSAGIGFFSENYPVHQMAEKTGDLESLAKANKDSSGKTIKNSVALFGEIDENLNHIYTWDTFINKVLNEKYDFIKSITVLNETDKEKYKDKIFIGKSKWYKLMDLIVSSLTKENNRLDIARFAYILGRINYTNQNKDNFNKFKENLLLWLKNKEEAKQLLTAINILIYEERGE